MCSFLFFNFLQSISVQKKSDVPLTLVIQAPYNVHMSLSINLKIKELKNRIRRLLKLFKPKNIMTC